MVIKYINTKEDYYDVLEYFGKKKLKVLNVIAFWLSIVLAICIYVLLYKFDNIYRIIISLLISILICVFAIKRNRESFYDVANKLVSNEMLELTIDNNLILMKTKEEEVKLTINKNKNYNLLNINNKWVLIDGNKSVAFIVPNNAFKSRDEEDNFLKLINKII